MREVSSTAQPTDPSRVKTFTQKVTRKGSREVSTQPSEEDSSGDSKSAAASSILIFVKVSTGSRGR
jgi:hypothetical protein